VPCFQSSSLSVDFAQIFTINSAPAIPIKTRKIAISPDHKRTSYTKLKPQEKDQMKKIGIIRCQQTEDICPGTSDFKAASQGKLAFEQMGSVEIIGFVSCGGCPGKRAVARAQMMVDRGAEVIAFASCISKGNPIGYPCPHFEEIKTAVIRKIGSKIEILNYTH
jgi:predicted metal-binding protein